eukprot:302775_1
MLFSFPFVLAIGCLTFDVTSAQTDEQFKTLSSRVSNLTLPDGFSISIYYYDPDIIDSPRRLASILYNNHTIIYVGNRRSRNPVYAMVDLNNDGINDYVKPVWYSTDNTHPNAVLIDPIQHSAYFITNKAITICYNANEFVLNKTNNLNCSLFLAFPIPQPLNIYGGHLKHQALFTLDGRHLCIPQGDCENCYSNKSDSYPYGMIRCFDMNILRDYDSN